MVLAAASRANRRIGRATQKQPAAQSETTAREPCWITKCEWWCFGRVAIVARIDGSLTVLECFVWSKPRAGQQKRVTAARANKTKDEVRKRVGWIASDSERANGQLKTEKMHRKVCRIRQMPAPKTERKTVGRAACRVLPRSEVTGRTLLCSALLPSATSQSGELP